MKWKLASIAMVAMLVLIGWLVWWPAGHSPSPPPLTWQSGPAPVDYNMIGNETGSERLDGATAVAPSAVPPSAAAPAPSSEGGGGAGPTNSFIVCPGNPRCPQ